MKMEMEARCRLTGAPVTVPRQRSGPLSRLGPGRRHWRSTEEAAYRHRWPWVSKLPMHVGTLQGRHGRETVQCIIPVPQRGGRRLHTTAWQRPQSSLDTKNLYVQYSPMALAQSLPGSLRSPALNLLLVGSKHL